MFYENLVKEMIKKITKEYLEGFIKHDKYDKVVVFNTKVEVKEINGDCVFKSTFELIKNKDDDYYYDYKYIVGGYVYSYGDIKMFTVEDCKKKLLWSEIVGLRDMYNIQAFEI